jgi:formate dehydrogenase iron-sulfur subunit
MKHDRVSQPLFTWPVALMAMIMIAGLVAAVVRFRMGLGATTNLSDDWPWGLWKGFNVLVLIALGAGGFTSAALIYIFGGERYHSLARPAVLWAILCYGFAGASLVVDIGVPWRIVNPIYMWPHGSVLFEVAWCVMLYLTVLALELAPSAFERFGWTRLEEQWRRFVPVYAVGALTFFTYIMTHSLAWMAASAIFFVFLAWFLPRVTLRSSTPVLLIMFGIILSSLHQSSLGSLFLLVPGKLSHYWWSMRLPLNFLASAVAVGFAMIIIERTVSAWAFKRPVPDDLLRGVARIAVASVWIYLVIRVVDVAAVAVDAAGAGQLAARFGGPVNGAMFFVELSMGFLLPALLLSRSRIRADTVWRLAAALFLVGGVAFNRLNVAFLGMNMEGTYVPSLVEVLVSLATVAAMLFFYTLAVKLLPIYESTEHVSDPGDPGRRELVTGPAAPMAAVQG